MSQTFNAGDYLVFQLESGYGLLRVLAVAAEPANRVWHLCVYEELFADIESAEHALISPESLHCTRPHLALTDRAFERTPAAKLGNRPVADDELVAVSNWQHSADRPIFDRSLLLLLGMR
jgi:hypothetical protein